MAQLKSTNITGNLAVTGNTLASKIIKLGGTNDDILMGDGSTTSKQALIDSLEASMEGDTNTWREIKVNDTSILGTGINTGSLNLKAGTNVSISNSGGTVTISSSYTDTDTGATSIEVTGTGNAVTAASYDATARKITLTKGATFLTSHQSLAAYVKGPSSSTDNAVARFDSTTGKVIQNSRATIDDTGNLKINNSDGGDIGLTLGRGSNADWRLFGSNGNFYIQGNYTTSKQTSFYSVLTLAYNSGNATVKGAVTADGFKHSNSTTGTNDYVLLAGGGTKSLSDFGTGSGNVSGSGLTADYIVLGNGSSSIKISSSKVSDFVTLAGTQTISGKKVFTANHGGSSTITSDLDAIKLAAVNRDGTKGTYMPGIAWNNLEIWSSNTYVGGAQAWIGTRMVDTTGSERVDLVFATKEDNTGGPIRPIERMCITYQGNVGIGTKAPSYPLQVNGNMAANDIICDKITFPQDSNPSMYSNPNIDGIYVDYGVESPQIKTSKILAPTTSGGSTYGVGTNGQVLKSNGTTVYWGADNSGGSTFTLPTRLAANSSSSVAANNALEQGWYYINDNTTNRPPFKQVDGATGNDYRIMTTAYGNTWLQQIATDFRSNDMFIRRNQSGTWQPWTAVVRTLPCTVDGTTHSMPSITDNAIVRWATDRTATIQNSGVTIDDSNNMTVPGYITTAENKMAVKFRTHTTYETGFVYGTSGNEALTLAIQNPVTAFQIVYGTKPSSYGGSTWQSVTPLFQTKDGKVIINRKIAATADTSALKLLDVNGEIGATKLTTSEIITGKLTFPQESNPSIYSSSNISGVYVDYGVETPQVRTNKIIAPTSSGGTTYGVGSNGQVLKSNGTTVYWASDSNNYAYVRQYQSGRNAAGTTGCYPLLARYNVTNKNASYDTAYSRFHTDAFLDTSNGQISTRGYNFLNSSGENKGNITLNANNDIEIACEGNDVIVAGSVNAYSGFYIQAPGGPLQNVATEDWVRQYVAENGGGGSSDPVVPEGDSELLIGFYRRYRLNYDADWTQYWSFYPREITGLEEGAYYCEPYSRYSENNQYVVYAECPDEPISVSTSWGMSFEKEGEYTYILRFLGEEGHLIGNPQWIIFAVGGAVYKLEVFFEDDYYVD